jgi:Ca2+-binding EF-hand superfamily protein
VFDFGIVLIGVIDFLVKLFDIQHAKVAKFVTVLRTLRVLRILRLLRVIKVFRALYGISVALFTSLKSVFWVTMMFSIIITVCAIFTTIMIGKDPDSYSDPELVKMQFGSVPASMNTLFQIVTLDDWSTVARVIVAKYPVMQIFFCLYILLTSFTMVSVMTGMITGQTQKVMDEQDERSEKKFQIFLHKAGRIFNHWDTNNSGSISCDEFLDLFHEKKVHGLLYVHGIDIDDEFEDGEELFSCFDHETNGEISISEFRDGLQRMRGNAKAKDFFRMQSMIRRVEEQLDNLGVEHSPEADTAFIHHRLNEMIVSAETLLLRMDRMEQEFRRFSRTMPPPDDDIVPG